MDASNKQKKISLNAIHSSSRSDLGISACQNHSLDELHFTDNTMPAIPIMQNMEHTSSQASQGSSGRRKRKAPSRSGELCGDDLSVLDVDCREATLRKAKNREAARKSRERKMRRVDNLTTSVNELTKENELLSKCIQELSEQRASVEAETQLTKEQIQAIRAKAASQEDRQVIDRLLDNAITMAHAQLPSQPQSQFHQLPLQVPMQSHVAGAFCGSGSKDNAEAAHWQGIPSTVQSSLIHPYAQQFMTPEEIVRGDRPSSASDTLQPSAMYDGRLGPVPQQGAEAGCMGGYAVNESGVTARGGSPASARAQPDIDTTPGAFPPHPKRSRSVRGGKAKRVSPPSAESFGGPLMLPLSELRYQQELACQVEGPQGLRREGSLDLLEAVGGIPSPESLLAGSLSSQGASFASGSSLSMGSMHDFFLDGASLLPPGVYAHSSSML